MSNTQSTSDLTLVPEAQWKEARRCMSIIQRLADNPTRSQEDMDCAVRELGFSRAQVYVLLRRYLADPRLTSLLPRRRGPDRGFSKLSVEVEKLVDEAIESVYLARQRPKISDLVMEVRRRCHAAGLMSPGRKAIAMRIRKRPRREIVSRREGSKAARDRFGPVVGSLEAAWPLALIQIDHTLVDVIVVDSVTRAPIQRPWLTLAIDVYSRCVAGLHLSLEPPSATSVALCIAHAVLPKQQWLADRKIDSQWPVQGLMARLHLDNAKEFRSEALRRGCEQYGISIDHRPVRTPHYGGHIERLIGTMMGKVHLLPGTTFSNVRVRGDLDPAKTATMTLDELDRWLGNAIAGVYHRTVHQSLNTTPIAAWERGIVGDATTPGCGEPTSVDDPRRLLIDFLPIERRLVRRDGLRLNSIHYWSDLLSIWIGEPEKMIIRYDPRDLSRIYLLGPDGQYHDIAYRDVRRPPISLWEHRLALKRLREERHPHIDEAAIFRTIDAMREIVDQATMTSKTVRRQRERRFRLIPGGRVDPPAAPECEPPVMKEGAVRQPHEDMLPVEEWT
jgi:putative transposase